MCGFCGRRRADVERGPNAVRVALLDESGLLSAGDIGPCALRPRNI